MPGIKARRHRYNNQKCPRCGKFRTKIATVHLCRSRKRTYWKWACMRCSGTEQHYDDTAGPTRIKQTRYRPRFVDGERVVSKWFEAERRNRTSREDVWVTG